MTGMTYIEGLRRYVMVSWHYNRENFETAIEARDLGAVLEFFEAPEPWGPWSKVKTFQTGQLGWFAPIIGQRFQSVKNSGTVNAFQPLIRSFSLPGELVPAFSGSGSSLIAAALSGRRYLGVELERKYVDLARRGSPDYL